MLSYQHIYHAGNFADVHKHAILALLFTSLRGRPDRIFLLDTHAGRGGYRLDSSEARKKNEFLSGISAVARHDDATPLAAYLDVVGKFNPSGDIAFYPGSALFAKELLRTSDRLVFAELHPGEHAELQKTFADCRNATLLHKSGFDCMEEMLPPPERKGIVVIDPPYELKSDYAEVPKSIAKAWKKWPTGIFVVWYPILQANYAARMLEDFQKTGIRDVLVSEINAPPKQAGTDGFGMTGSGMIVVNPPWPESVLASLSHHVADALPGGMQSRVFWL